MFNKTLRLILIKINRFLIKNFHKALAATVLNKNKNMKTTYFFMKISIDYLTHTNTDASHTSA